MAGTGAIESRHFRRWDFRPPDLAGANNSARGSDGFSDRWRMRPKRAHSRSSLWWRISTTSKLTQARVSSRVAPADSAVLIYGETGTGKELIARAVHNLTSRKSNAFVKLNCA